MTISQVGFFNMGIFKPDQSRCHSPKKKSAPKKNRKKGGAKRMGIQEGASLAGA